MRILGADVEVFREGFFSQGRFESARAKSMEVADEPRVDLLLPGTPGRIELEYPARLVQPSAWIGHIPFALWLIGALKPGMVTELGVHTGNSYCAFLQAVHTLGIETRCFGIDHWQGDAHSGHYGDEVYNELRAYHDPRYGTFSTLLRSSFEESRPYFSDGSVDLLHIDGFHTYEAVSADFQSWLPKVSSRGVALFHDINVRERGFGIWQFWEEVTSRYPHFEFLHSHGLGIVYLGSEPLTGPLKTLFAAKTIAEREGIQNYFARLGISVVERLATQTLAAEIDTMKAQVGSLAADLTEARSKLDEAERNAEAVMVQARIKTSMTQQRLAVTARLQRELIAANLETNSLQADAAHLHQELHTTNLETARLRQELHAANLETARLHQELHTANLETARLRQELHTANLETARLRQELHTANLETARVHQDLHTANLETAHLRQELNNANLERRSWHVDMTRLQQELVTADLEKDIYQRRLDDVLQSRSWWLTKPLRWANAGLRRLPAQDPQPDDGSRTAVTKS